MRCKTTHFFLQIITCLKTANQIEMQQSIGFQLEKGREIEKEKEKEKREGRTRPNSLQENFFQGQGKNRVLISP